ncbi:MAG: hypothetical protein DVB22_000315 [Verrucomicrobia bacterium]|nr:MAG: hypothetical protein DVB22_000315 [Verrucomicrobiota bacterium]
MSLRAGGAGEEVGDIDAAGGGGFECGSLAGEGRARGGADGGVLLLEEFLGFGGPRHQFAVEAEPIRFEFVPEAGGGGGIADSGQEVRFDPCVVEEASAGAGEAGADALALDAEAPEGGFFVAADHDHGAGPHVFFLTDHAGDALVAVVGEGFRRVFQQAVAAAGGARRHGGREVDEPFRIGGEAAHDFEGGGGVFLADGDIAVPFRANDPLADDVLDIEHVVVLLLG